MNVNSFLGSVELALGRDDQGRGISALTPQWSLGPGTHPVPGTTPSRLKSKQQASLSLS
jgi:hypothetical protein